MGADRSSLRVTTLAALIVVAAVAIRGSLPGAAHHVSGAQPAHNAAATACVVVLLGVSMAIIAIAVLARIRDPRASVTGGAGRLEWYRGTARSRWRLVLIVAGLVFGGLLFAAMLTRWSLPHPGFLPGPTSTPDAVPGTPPPARPPNPAQPRADGDLSALLYVTAIGFLALVVAGSIFGARRGRFDTTEPARADAWTATPPEVPAESLARAAEVALAEVGDPSREPRAAIIACYAAMEGELARVPGAAPRDFDTASEVLARAVEHGALRHDSATQLVELFEEARFSPHVMDEGHRGIAARVLRRVLAELRGEG